MSPYLKTSGTSRPQYLPSHGSGAGCDTAFKRRKDKCLKKKKTCSLSLLTELQTSRNLLSVFFTHGKPKTDHNPLLEETDASVQGQFFSVPVTLEEWPSPLHSTTAALHVLKSLLHTKYFHEAITSFAVFLSPFKNDFSGFHLF